MNRERKVSDAKELDLRAEELVRVLLSLEPERRLSLLDSCGAQGANLLIAGFDPFEIIEVKDGQASIFDGQGESVEVSNTDALELLDERMAKYATQDSGDGLGAGACIATFSYETVHQVESLRAISEKPRDKREPDAVFAFYDALIVHDYESEKTLILSNHPQRLEEIEETILNARVKPLNESGVASVAHSNMTRDEYLGAVQTIKEHIAAGDIYQANLTQQFTCQLPPESKPEDVFLRLRQDHPAPFAAFIRRREDTIVSISPERFLRVDATQSDARQVEAWPIKGTRPRGTNEMEDARLRAELESSEKDRAENVMIVDLLRNDLGRVCHYGSVSVMELCTIAKHPTLFHLVSKVRGTLRDEVTAGDLLRATFPCGSITGAPKIRAMEIIDEVETAPRGLSMGAIGYFGFDGSMDLSVAIRTMTVLDGVARFNVGGGIVADSNPAQEYEESLVKARALFRALGVKSQEAT